MKKIIITTTINPPTPQIRKYDAMKDWHLLVVGDVMTPEYKLKRGTYLSWEWQQKNYPDLCDLIGPNSVRRGRMISFIEAYKRGADVAAVIDDDNMPYENWGKDLLIGKRVKVLSYETSEIAFDPLSVHRLSAPVWHRGFPLELVRQQTTMVMRERTITPLVQANLWDGDPDIDATVRMAIRPNLVIPQKAYYTTNAFSPVNTQNTFIHRKALKHFPANIPWIGRADDIWASYLFEARHPNSVVYGPATVLHQQERSIRSMVNDLKEEIFLYENNLKFLTALRDQGVDYAMKTFMPPDSVAAIKLYESYFK